MYIFYLFKLINICKPKLGEEKTQVLNKIYC